MVEWLFLSVPWDCLRFVIVVFADHTHLLFLPESSIVARLNGLYQNSVRPIMVSLSFHVSS